MERLSIKEYISYIKVDKDMRRESGVMIHESLNIRLALWAGLIRPGDFDTRAGLRCTTQRNL
jgi:hypothetical protein